MRRVRVLEEGEAKLGAESAVGGRLAESAGFFDCVITELEGLPDAGRHGAGEA